MRAAAPAAIPAVPGPRNRWWIVPAVLVGLVVVVWLFLMGMPFRASDKPVERPKVETIAEAPVPSAQSAQSATIVEVSADEPESAPTPEDSPPARQPIPPAQPPARRQVSAEISPSDAEAILRNYVTSSNFYRLQGECLRINNRGYRNVGYTLEVWDACQAGGASRMLGSWRVDAKTRELFRRRDDGRYLKP